MKLTLTCIINHHVYYKIWRLPACILAMSSTPVLIFITLPSRMANEEQLAAESAQRAAEVAVEDSATREETTLQAAVLKFDEAGDKTESLQPHHAVSESYQDPISGREEEVAHDVTAVGFHNHGASLHDDNASRKLLKIDESETALPESQKDTDVAAEASIDVGPAQSDGISELRRLRDLVFASRGSRANLPPGWDDDGADHSAVPAKEDKVAILPETKKDAIVSSKGSVDEAAQKMLQRAIDVVGQYASDSDSNDNSSDSDSDSSSASSSSASQPAGKEAKTKKKKPDVIQGALSDEEEEGGAVGAFGPRTKNEVIEPTVDQPPYSSVPLDKEIRPLGKIHSIVDCVVVVAQDVGKAPGQPNQQVIGHRPAPVDMHGRKGEEEGEYSVLDTGSLLAFGDRNVLGVVFETFGSVLSPLYALRYSSASQVNKDMIQMGKPVFYVPSDSTYVLTRALRALGKGSDASNLWDEEVGDDEREFSDDEAEAEHKRNAKANKSKNKKRSHPEENGVLGNSSKAGPSRPIKHSLPSRPLMAPPVHRDAAGGQQNVNLMYDDDDAAPRPLASVPLPNLNMYLPALPPPSHHVGAPVAPHDPYALWQYQQQQQQYQPHLQQPVMPSPMSQHYQQSFYQPMQQSMQQQQHYPTRPPNGESYNPQQPHLGPFRPPQ